MSSTSIVGIFLFVCWLVLINIIVQSEGNGLTNAEWLAGVVVTFGLLFLWGYITKDMD